LRHPQLRTELQGFVADFVEGSTKLEDELASGGVPVWLQEATITHRLHFVVENGICKFADGVLPLGVKWVSETDWVAGSEEELSEAFRDPGDHTLWGFTTEQPFLGNVVRDHNNDGALVIRRATTPDEIARVADYYREVFSEWDWLATQIGQRRADAIRPADS